MWSVGIVWRKVLPALLFVKSLRVAALAATYISTWIMMFAYIVSIEKHFVTNEELYFPCCNSSQDAVPKHVIHYYSPVLCTAFQCLPCRELLVRRLIYVFKRVLDQEPWAQRLCTDRLLRSDPYIAFTRNVCEWLHFRVCSPCIIYTSRCY